MPDEMGRKNISHPTPRLGQSHKAFARKSHRTKLKTGDRSCAGLLRESRSLPQKFLLS